MRILLVKNRGMQTMNMESSLKRASFCIRQFFQMASYPYQQTAISFNVLTVNTKDMSNRYLKSGYTDC